MHKITKTDEGILQILHGQSGAIDLPKPFEQEIHLFDTVIAGTTHVKNIDLLVKNLQEGDDLQFFREPKNKHDERAIVIRTRTGDKLGFVPQADNIVFSRLMDAGKLLFGRITKMEERGSWWKITIRIFLKE